MSLDMFLTKNTYVGGADNKLKISGIKSQVQIPRVKHITEEIAYWRKANAIHNWFVVNVQEGEDDNGVYNVSTDQLQELLRLCKQVVRDPNKAPELLPTKDGFLFGSTEYDSQYFQSIEYTAKILEAALQEDNDQLQEYVYQSDW